MWRGSDCLGDEEFLGTGHFLYLGIDYLDGIPINLYTYRKWIDTGELRGKKSTGQCVRFLFWQRGL
jgi:hypothetical protein